MRRVFVIEIKSDYPGNQLCDPYFKKERNIKLYSMLEN